ncbi:hypothetical protein [Nocardia miyunensis]|uniref:hypothetical protein n=1 Tax=Nocardia miyunensis TaxID=282684 RepID=UPI0008301B04|nr:hypothetical protein [Nocardia miyunensis]
MITVLASAIAVVGTLLGSVLTFVFQRQTARQTAATTFAEHLRQDRLLAYSTFAESAILFRKSEIDRWYRSDEDPSGEPHRIATAESHRLRAALRNALLRVELVTNDPHLHELGTTVIETTRIIHNATSRHDCSSRADAAIAAIRQFISHAAANIQTPQLTGSPSPVNRSRAISQNLPMTAPGLPSDEDDGAH